MIQKAKIKQLNGQKLRNPPIQYAMQGEQHIMTTMLTTEEKELLARAANLMEELLEPSKSHRTKPLPKNSNEHSKKSKTAKHNP